MIRSCQIFQGGGRKGVREAERSQEVGGVGCDVKVGSIKLQMYYWSQEK